MSELKYLHSQKSVDAVEWLLPRADARAILAMASASLLLMSDFSHVQRVIGVPSSLELDLKDSGLDHLDNLPLKQHRYLLEAVPLFAMAFDVFGDLEQTKRWWNTPISLAIQHGHLSPRDWVSVPGATLELKTRIGRTIGGVF